jgi:hypothetical protein
MYFANYFFNIALLFRRHYAYRRVQEKLYRQTPIFLQPFFRKQCFSLKYVLVTPLKIFGGMPKFGIHALYSNSGVQFTILTVQGP